VQAEEANPQNVRIDLSQPIPPSCGVVNLPPKVTFNQSSWSPQSGWSGSPPPADIADQIKAAIDTAFNQSQGAGPVIQQPNLAAPAGMYPQNLGNAVISAAALLATGQRVPALLKSFSPMGTTPRSLGRTPSRPELIDAPHYMLEVELDIPNSGPITGRAIQPVPVPEVPNLAIGRQLTCAVDPIDPSRRFVVDWGSC
jgi:hypothetical protein